MLPLSALLSSALVAFTIEFDNEFERRVPHRTSDYGPSPHQSARKPWLISLVMWQNCLRFVPPEGISPAHLEQLARTKTNLAGMRRWGWVKLNENRLICLTQAGLQAREVCPVMLNEIEERWRARYSSTLINHLRHLLLSFRRPSDDLPDSMPILRYGLFAGGTHSKPAAEASPDLSLPALLARPLVAIARQFERDRRLSLALSADVLRPIPDASFSLRDLPALGGVSKEATAMGVKFLAKHGLATITAGTPKQITLTPHGHAAQRQYARKLARIEAAWQGRLPALDDLRRSLHVLVGDAARQSPLFPCLQTTPENWRARRPSPQTLPHFPMVLHRGGYPDGS